MTTAKLENAALAMLLACALIVTSLLVRREFFPPNPDRNERVDNWTELANGGHNIGGASRSATLTVFSDFQCPFCKQFVPVIDSLIRAHPNLRVVERNFPLAAIHPKALEAATASECGARAGKYREMRNALYSNPELVSQGNWIKVATMAGITDTVALRGCLSDLTVRAIVERDIEVGKKAGIKGTPGVFLNDLRYGLPPDYDVLDRAVRSLERN